MICELLDGHEYCARSSVEIETLECCSMMIMLIMMIMLMMMYDDQ